jgi:glycosyltransferase involved in cell wall biosynthesis
MNDEPLGSAREIMDSKIRVSVIISFLNAERFLGETIESVLSQTFKSWELLLVDDGSSDCSTRIAREYAERHPGVVRYLQHHLHRNRGLPASRNTGIKNANGEYIALLDADDLWLPNKLERQVKILDSHPDAALVYGATLYWHSWAHGEQSDSLMAPGIPTDRVYDPPGLLSLTLSNKAVSPCPSDLMFRKDSIASLGAFEESFIGIFSMYEDQAFLIKVYAEVPVYVSSECWDRYRVHPDQLCATVIRAGKKRQAEFFFLSWAREYLSTRGQLDPESESILNHRMWPYLHPYLERLKQAPEHVATRAKRAFARKGGSKRE